MIKSNVLLDVNSLSAGYGKVDVLQDISLKLNANETVAVIGANGSGKSTLVSALCGLIPSRGGRIMHRDVDLTCVPSHRRVREGIGTVLEGRHLFGPMTARQHLTLAELAGNRSERRLQFTIEDVLNLFPFLRERLDDAVELMSGGEQQMVALARALLLQPHTLMLDEPSTGLSPLIVRQIMHTIAALKERGMGILLVEQNVALAAEVADRGYVLSVGKIAHEVQSGGWDDLLKDENLVKVYLGG